MSTKEEEIEQIISELKQMGMKGEWTTHMTDTEKEQLKRYVDQRIRSRPNPIEMLALMTLLIQYSQNIQRERSQQQQTQHTGPVVCTMAVSPNTQTTYLEQYRQEELERQKKAKIEQSLAPVLKRIEEEKQKTLRRIESLKQSRQVQKQQPAHDAPSAPTLSPGEIEGLHREDRPPSHNPQSVPRYKEVSEEHSKSTTNENKECCVCLLEVKELLAIIPCGHRCICQSCAEILMKREKNRECPICRGPMEGVLKIYG